MTWKTLRTAADIPFFLTGLALTIYIGFAAFGYTSNSSEHYSNFILGVVVMTGLLAVRNLCDEKLGIPDPETDMLRPVRPYFWGRFAFAAVALIMATIAMGYVRLNAVHLEVSQPFFNKTDMVFGWLMTISILMLTFIHWGWLLTSVVAAAIAYFFLGYKIENPLFMTPQYSNEFVMNYIGLGTNQGFYYLAQVAADAIYFLIIYAAILLGVGMLDMVLEVGKATGRRVPGGAAGPAPRRVGCHRMTSPETVHPQKRAALRLNLKEALDHWLRFGSTDRGFADCAMYTILALSDSTRKREHHARRKQDDLITATQRCRS